MTTTLQQAIALKEAGYDVPCDWYMLDDGSVVNIDTMWSDFIVGPAPTLHEACDWLRDVKGLHVYCMQTNKGTWSYFIERVPRTGDIWHSSSFPNPTTFPDHNAALSAAVDKALLILKERE